MVIEGAYERNALAIADRQRGRANREQLLAADWTPGRVRGATGRGWLRGVGRGVYLVGADVRTPLARETEALLDAGLHTALCGVSVLMALNLVPRCEGPIHLTSASGGRHNSRPGLTFHTFSDLTPADVRVREGLPMTTVERALLDAAAGGDLDARGTERALDEAVALRLTSRTKLRELLARTHQRPGHRFLSDLADPRRPNSRTESELAEEALALIRAAKLPEPTTEENLFGFRADKYWPEAGVVLEVDSFTFHGLIRANFERDRRKDRIYAQNGIQVVRWSDDDIHKRALEITADLGMTVARRTAERAARRAAAEILSERGP